MPQTKPMILGWEEWVALPDLGLPAIKAKVDTGAKTSALHAHLIEPFGPPERPMVRFLVHPEPGRDALEIACTAPLLERREVASSNGGREMRAVIATDIVIAGRRWPIELTLTNRAAMSYRMLLGRQAVPAGVLIDPAGSFRQPRLSYAAYPRLGAGGGAARPLAIALVTRRPKSGSVARLAAAAQRLGHRLDVLDVAGLELALDGSGGLREQGRGLPHYDAVVPRLGPGKGAAFANACVRQLEALGALSLNSADALDRLRNAALVAQLLDRVRLASALARLADRTADPAPRPGARLLRCLVVGGHVAAIAEAHGPELTADVTGRVAAVPKIARRAALTVGLGLAAVDVEVGTAGDGHPAVPRVIAISAQPALSRFARACGVDAAALVLAEVAARVQGRAHGVPWLGLRDASASDLP